MADIFKYLDYRHFLRDFYREKKEVKGSVYSFRLFSRQAGFAAPNFLQLVMEGKRNLSLDGIHRFIKGLRLNREEARFFENLVQFNQATYDAEKTKWYQRLATSKRYREIKKIEIDQFVYYSRWYFTAIRELVLLPDFKEDPKWIAQRVRPKITPKEAAEALELLEGIGFLKRDKGKRLVQTDRNITTEREVASLAIANYHRQMMERAAQSIDMTPGDKRDISSLTVAMSREKFIEAKRRIQEFRRELNVLLSDEGKTDSVYQINFQIFNLTEVPWPGGK